MQRLVQALYPVSMHLDTQLGKLYDGRMHALSSSRNLHIRLVNSSSAGPVLSTPHKRVHRVQCSAWPVLCSLMVGTWIVAETEIAVGLRVLHLSTLHSNSTIGRL